MNKILVNVEVYYFGSEKDYANTQGIAPGSYIVSLEIAGRHFINNQYWSADEAFADQKRLIETYENFAEGKVYETKK